VSYSIRYEVIFSCEADLTFQISSGVFTLCHNEHYDYFESDDICVCKVCFVVQKNLALFRTFY
jgi:hypothetical protein